MKKVSLFLGMVLAASFAMAQPNTAITVQNGTGNGAALAQSGTSNDGVVYQLWGDHNGGTLIQTGAGNDATIVQGLTSVASGTWGANDNIMGASNNTGFIRQIGSNDDGAVYQLGNRNYGVVDINGSNNDAQVYQGWGTIDGGYATSGNSDYSVLTQNGSNNTAYAWQYGGVQKDLGVYDNVNNITQTGNYNFATVAQGYTYLSNSKGITPIYGAAVTGNISNIAQLNGDWNLARFFQLGKNNTISLTQNGSLNNVGAERTTGGVSLDGYFYQTGDDNHFTGTQTGGATLAKASAQLGNGNIINMAQGANDWAVITQDGNLNQAYLTQYGGGQNATIQQTGISNVSTVTQGN